MNYIKSHSLYDHSCPFPQAINIMCCLDLFMAASWFFSWCSTGPVCLCVLLLPQHWGAGASTEEVASVSHAPTGSACRGTAGKHSMHTPAGAGSFPPADTQPTPSAQGHLHSRAFQSCPWDLCGVTTVTATLVQSLAKMCCWCCCSL